MNEGNEEDLDEVNQLNMLYIGRGLDKEWSATLPVDFCTTVTAVLGTRGSGKTNTLVVLAEELYRLQIPFTIIDPLSVTWGLKSSMDGESAGIPVVVLGGAHGDLPLTPDSGELIANLVTDRPGYYILDLSSFDSDAEGDRFASAFAKRLIRAKTEKTFPMCLMVDEADMFMPQQPQPGQQPMLGHFNAIARRGRVRGLGMVVATQRAAVLNKNTLSMAECLLGMKLMSPQDQAAVEDYVKKFLDPAERQAFMRTLPSFKVGQGWLWAPHWLEALSRVQIRARTTFDSSNTPKVGERQVVPRVLSEVDLDEIREQMGALVEKPAPASAPTSSPKTEISTLQSEIDQLKWQVQKQRDVIKDLDDEKDDLDQRIKLIRQLTDGDFSGTLVPSDKRWIPYRWPDHEQRPAPYPVDPTSPDDQDLAGDDTRAEGIDSELPVPGGETVAAPLSKTERDILDVLNGWRLKPLDQKVVALLAGRSLSGSFKQALASLRVRNYIMGKGTELQITYGAAAVVGEPKELPEDPGERLTYWTEKLSNKVEREILICLYNKQGETMDQSKVAEFCGYTQSGSFKQAVARLIDLGLVSRPSTGVIKAQMEYFS